MGIGSARIQKHAPIQMLKNDKIFPYNVYFHEQKKVLFRLGNTYFFFTIVLEFCQLSKYWNSKALVFEFPRCLFPTCSFILKLQYISVHGTTYFFFCPFSQKSARSADFFRKKGGKGSAMDQIEKSENRHF